MRIALPAFASEIFHQNRRLLLIITVNVFQVFPVNSPTRTCTVQKITMLTTIEMHSLLYSYHEWGCVLQMIETLLLRSTALPANAAFLPHGIS